MARYCSRVLTRTIRGGTRAHLTTPKVLRAVPGRWRFWSGSLRCSPSNPKRCINGRSGKLLRCIAKLWKLRALRNPTFNGKGETVSEQKQLHVSILINDVFRVSVAEKSCENSGRQHNHWKPSPIRFRLLSVRRLQRSRYYSYRFPISCRR